ncbi:hypothetical protein NIES2104_11890 [Leptolyngbya sp. NIES-2104]|nr:hypothetical protein NIES2104_11890 [Leptolyngbya sp. NIES-2104]
METQRVASKNLVMSPLSKLKTIALQNSKGLLNQDIATLLEAQ